MGYHLFSKKWLIARKPHTCIWCYRRIEGGDVYLREASIYDGRHQDHAWHWDCWFDAHETYFRYEEEFVPGHERPAPLSLFRSMEAWT